MYFIVSFFWAGAFSFSGWFTSNIIIIIVLQYVLFAWFFYLHLLLYPLVTFKNIYLLEFKLLVAYRMSEFFSLFFAPHMYINLWITNKRKYPSPPHEIVQNMSSIKSQELIWLINERIVFLHPFLVTTVPRLAVCKNILLFNPHSFQSQGKSIQKHYPPIPLLYIWVMYVCKRSTQIWIIEMLKWRLDQKWTKFWFLHLLCPLLRSTLRGEVARIALRIFRRLICLDPLLKLIQVICFIHWIVSRLWRFWLGHWRPGWKDE